MLATVVAFDTEPISQVLAALAADTRIKLGASLWGFGGVHGGLALGLLTAAMRRNAEGRVLQRVSGQFRRPLREEFALDVVDEGSGRTVSWLAACASVQGSPAVTARAIFANPGKFHVTPVAAPMPSAPPPSDCPTFTVPPEFVPFARRTEIRPVGNARPFIGGPKPELIAWLRLVDDDAPPDEARLVVLMDSLAPSYGAVLSAPVPIPTVTFSVTPGTGLTGAKSPWILLRARTESAGRNGWLVERLDAWGPDGAHLGSGEQLRVISPPKEST